MNKGNSYEARDRTLKRMGFHSYRAYLKSDLWKDIRFAVFVAKGHYCYLCGRYATQVHHSRYKPIDLEGGKLTFLNPICAKCHKNIERNPDGSKRDFHEVKHLYREKRAEREFIKCGHKDILKLLLGVNATL